MNSRSVVGAFIPFSLAPVSAPKRSIRCRPGEQRRLERGQISVGDITDMVYIALGAPDERRDIATADGTQTVWVYRTYWQQYEGTAWLGYRRVIVPANNGRGYVIFHEPVTQDVYRTHVDDRIRVTLNNGIVQSVEQMQR